METKLSYANIINDKVKILPNVGNVILYDDFMNIIFGGKMKSVSRIELLNKKFLVNNDEKDGQIFFILEKIQEYIQYVLKKVNWEEEKLIPINYFKCLELIGLDIPMTELHIKIFKILTEFKEYLESKDDNHSKILLNLFWKDKFKGFVTSNNEMPFLISVVFPKVNSLPFILNITDGLSVSKNSLSIDIDNNFDEIYNEWVNILLMESSDNYVITCLEEVTGSIDLAKFIFYSHKEKENFIIKVNSLNQIINFKKSKEKAYLDKFLKLYENSNIYNIKEDLVYLNFEGFNKYLLNLEDEYLEDFEDKERINTLYYNVMDELVNSYKKLYLFFRKNLFIHENQSGCMV